MINQKRAKHSEAVELINQALNEWLKIDSEKFEEFNPEEIELLFKSPSHDLEHESAISELFYQKFLTFREMKQYEKADQAAQNTVYILEKIKKRTKNYSFEAEQRMIELQNYISGAKN